MSAGSHAVVIRRPRRMSRRPVETVYLGVISLLGFLLFASGYLAAMEITDLGAAAAPPWADVLSVVGLSVAVLAFGAMLVSLVRRPPAEA
ncbi:hypothetical protein [Arsenicicoccus sp. oral taxon 190]|uniref:hypothetical protein n=1 Tax=Arsenicicoccus sp. oral taxon 190 TaxID=1658671 RepID=UPI0012E2EE1C|nr:hypothetical protein [Arsenicicoccus sp. oral taxon 190]